MIAHIARAAQGDRLDDDGGYAVWDENMTLVAVCKTKSIATSLAAALGSDVATSELDELDERFAKLDARMAERLTGLAEKFGTLGSSIATMARAQLEAARMSEEGPALRHRMNLASMCYGIRLRTACEQRPDQAVLHRQMATVAVADADALIAALGERS